MSRCSKRGYKNLLVGVSAPQLRASDRSASWHLRLAIADRMTEKNSGAVPDKAHCRSQWKVPVSTPFRGRSLTAWQCVGSLPYPRAFADGRVLLCALVLSRRPKPSSAAAGFTVGRDDPGSARHDTRTGERKQIIQRRKSAHLPPNSGKKGARQSAGQSTQSFASRDRAASATNFSSRLPFGSARNRTCAGLF